MSVNVNIEGDINFQAIQARFEQLQSSANREKLLTLIGGEVETQTHHRIRVEQTAPDGSRWDAWSDSYAATRAGSQSLLMSSGALDDSIQSYVKGNNIHVGSPLAYAGVHQDGFDGAVNVSSHTRTISQAFGKALKFPVHQTVSAHSRHMNIPQRQYLGLSDDNQKQLLTLIARFYDELG